MAIRTLPSDSKKLLKLLNKHGVEYLLISGYAVAHYGYVRATQELDLWLAVSEENDRRTVRALAEFESDLGSLSSEQFQKPDRVIRIGHPPLRVEFLTTV
jgi:hypothetical protein